MKADVLTSKALDLSDRSQKV